MDSTFHGRWRCAALSGRSLNAHKFVVPPCVFFLLFGAALARVGQLQVAVALEVVGVELAVPESAPLGARAGAHTSKRNGHCMAALCCVDSDSILKRVCDWCKRVRCKWTCGCQCDGTLGAASPSAAHHSDQPWRPPAPSLGPEAQGLHVSDHEATSTPPVV